MLPFSELWVARRAAKIMEKPMRTHFGDPCIHCGIAHDDVPVGPCTGDPAKAKPISFRSLGIRWDRVEHVLLQMSDGRIENCWEHVDLIDPVIRGLPYNDSLRRAST